jgi:hypothetical protein
VNILIPVDENVEISSIKLNIVCKNNALHTWGCYLNHDGSLPSGWNLCIKCFLRNRENMPDKYRFNDAK